MKTPCIGICSTNVSSDPICSGCRRTVEEISIWNSLSLQERHDKLIRIVREQSKEIDKLKVKL